MNSTLIYDGTLDAFTAEQVRWCLREHACPVEVRTDSSFWSEFLFFSKTGMKQIKRIIDDDDPVNRRIYEGPSYATLGKNSEEDVKFIFFEFESDRQAFLKRFEYLKPNGMPFKMLIK